MTEIMIIIDIDIFIIVPLYFLFEIFITKFVVLVITVIFLCAYTTVRDTIFCNSYSLT